MNVWSSRYAAIKRAIAATAYAIALSPWLRLPSGGLSIEISRVGWLGRTSILARAVSALRSLARVNGWGSAGQCPARLTAKTPAVREQDVTCASAQAGTGGGVG